MKHFASPDFWRKYHLLPQTIRDLADRHFRLMKADPRHPSLRLKKAGEFWSVRIGLVVEIQPELPRLEWRQPHGR